MLNRNFDSDRITLGDFNECEFKKIFETLFLSTFRPLCFYCQHKFGLGHDTATDTVHNAFIKLWEKRKSLHGYETLKAYLYKVVTNSCLNIIDHDVVKKKHEKYILQNSFFSAIENPDVDLVLKELDKAISDLPDQMRTIFVLSRENGLKYHEIAALLSISIKTVETQLRRALFRLRHRFKPL